jgi:hypothetical protein
LPGLFGESSLSLLLLSHRLLRQEFCLRLLSLLFGSKSFLLLTFPKKSLFLSKGIITTDHRPVCRDIVDEIVGC